MFHVTEAGHVNWCRAVGCQGPEATISQIISPELRENFHEGLGVALVACSLKGWRKTQEDTSSIVINLGGKRDMLGVGVFDGHSGPEASKYVSEHLWNEVTSTRNWSLGDVDGALRAAFLEIDANMRRDKVCHGTTAVVAVVTPSYLYVANCGDSRAVICKDGMATALSTDHKPSLYTEKARVVRCGGQVIPGEFGGVSRVTAPGCMVAMATSRSLGDFHFKRGYHSEAGEQIISPAADVTCIRRSPQDEFLILGTDGVWDVLSNQEVSDMMRASERAKQPPPAEGMPPNHHHQQYNPHTTHVPKFQRAFGTADDSTTENNPVETSDGVGGGGGGGGGGAGSKAHLRPEGFRSGGIIKRGGATAQAAAARAANGLQTGPPVATKKQRSGRGGGFLGASSSSSSNSSSSGHSEENGVDVVKERLGGGDEAGGGGSTTASVTPPVGGNSIGNGIGNGIGNNIGIGNDIGNNLAGEKGTRPKSRPRSRNRVGVFSDSESDNEDDSEFGNGKSENIDRIGGGIRFGCGSDAESENPDRNVGEIGSNSRIGRGGESGNRIGGESGGDSLASGRGAGAARRESAAGGAIGGGTVVAMSDGAVEGRANEMGEEIGEEEPTVGASVVTAATAIAEAVAAKVALWRRPSRLDEDALAAGGSSDGGGVSAVDSSESADACMEGVGGGGDGGGGGGGWI
eukprot:jgi/Undpi1/6810/HiC_scaffold_21.g09286.m1